MRDLIERDKAIEAVAFYKLENDPYPRVIESLKNIPAAGAGTNYGSLLSLNEEEMADFISDFLFERQKLCAFETEANTGLYRCPGYDRETGKWRCNKCWLDWLKMEVAP